MYEYFFGLGKGWLPKKIDKIARKNGAWLVNYTDPQCLCGWGCRIGECKKSRRHWFASKNKGEPFNSITAKNVMEAISKVK